jgi:hypothetical protein
VDIEKVRSIASDSIEFLHRDEFFSPLAMVLGGMLILIVGTLFRKFANFQMSRGLGNWTNGSSGRELLERFEKRIQFSKLLVAFGAIWLLQLVIETV